ncbi:16S rRNA (guanine(527)-N(7))-methyltransferase RsmG [Agrobacterium fabrum]|uniref:Ribosomal RNA small subunit methyltransferase G n=1 Tax=Agrobacterium fabrum TaxID=1176649 RepID=A0A7Z7FR72_9HYPH|nr:16S rRNA (guanine(527)-N(7))-methyltransferase RsmG [Agrobacterium fabrum]MCR6723762.1 16S rRNA (guanine(527)-N(7))-methyltransferase RsmG [Agrobacterium fabrum]WCK76090.1 16S rRNA (guanine(527)-N(7))-methyltransferase RsmG [Agrobacterium fabrum]WIE27185.1 16S rRNA (guanine(527)-N(7))-methyltransferase RsmG [Agrobacterium fabrum]WIE43142.1 16S rRNA (guanine(527)-N(7))-methyltransferase RsmG [Agrobacterium fabrum]CAH0219515.1 Ribosomal RNA small subunit methyltransferase G [Agrobacterium fab
MKINGQSVSRETQEKLEHFVELFKKWNNTTNLVAPSTLTELWSRHVADSAQIFQLSPQPKKWIDLGSGGGFPGVITAIFLAELGDGWVDLVESNNKKAAFLRIALKETGARGAVHPVRIETASEIITTCDAVSARALADLDLLFEYIRPWAQNNTKLKAYFNKGRDYDSEVQKAHGRWQFDLIKHRSAIEADSVVLEISNLVLRR